MPGKHGFTSKAQQGLIFAKQARGELPKGTATRMAGETSSFKKLPQYKYKGGMVGRTESLARNASSSKQYGGSVAMHKYGGGMVGASEHDLVRASDQYSWPHPVDMHAAQGGHVYKMLPDEFLARHPDQQYGGPVNMTAAYGGTADGDESLARHPEDEYGGPVDMSAAHGGVCPHCGGQLDGYAHGGNIGRHMQPGFQDMDTDVADQEADLHLGKALLQEKMFSREPKHRR